MTRREPMEYSGSFDPSVVYWKEAWYWSQAHGKWVLDYSPPMMSGDRILRPLTEEQARQRVEAMGSKWVQPNTPGSLMNGEGE